MVHFCLAEFAPKHYNTIFLIEAEIPVQPIKTRRHLSGSNFSINKNAANVMQSVIG